MRSRVSNMVVYVVPWRQPRVFSAQNGKNLDAEVTFRAAYEKTKCHILLRWSNYVFYYRENVVLTTSTSQSPLKWNI